MKEKPHSKDEINSSESSHKKCTNFLKSLAVDPDYDICSEPIINQNPAYFFGYKNQNLPESVEESISYNIGYQVTSDPSMNMLGIPTIVKIAKDIFHTKVKRKPISSLKSTPLRNIVETMTASSKIKAKMKKGTVRFTFDGNATSLFNFSVIHSHKKNKKNQNRLVSAICTRSQINPLDKLTYLSETFKKIEYCEEFMVRRSNEHLISIIHGKIEIFCPIVYDGFIPLLDKPEYKFETKRVVLRIYGLSYITILNSCDEKNKKKAINTQFCNKFPSCRISLTKLRNLKRKMYCFGKKNHLEEKNIAHSLLFLERLVFTGHATKTTRKLYACSCIIISTKIFQDKTKVSLSKLVNHMITEFRVVYQAILSFEIHTLALLNFGYTAKTKVLRFLIDSVKESLKKK